MLARYRIRFRECLDYSTELPLLFMGSDPIVDPCVHGIQLSRLEPKDPDRRTGVEALKAHPQRPLSLDVARMVRNRPGLSSVMLSLASESTGRFKKVLHMKIAFLNPWKHAAENQIFSSLRIAAARIGHDMVHCVNSSDVENCSPDFVLAMASTQPKLNDVPYYGIIHEPRDRFLGHREYFDNLLTYDGYLTISDTLERFLRDVSYGAGRPRPSGYFYTTCQRQDRAADLRSLIDRRALQITYFGTNWDKRRQGFFRILSEAEGVQICGPKHSWPDINPKSYGGGVDFDGASVQEKYAANGIGLCMLSNLHLRDNIVSNRIFEIASVGAIALCCDIPWIRDQFGDSVYYFDQTLRDRALSGAVLKLRELIYSNPGAAIEKAHRAREIFETKFAAEIMIENAVKYHQMVSANRARILQSAGQAYSPFISVVLRCGSRAIEYVERAVRSISRQTFGEFEVVLVRHKEIDLSAVAGAQFPRIRSFKVVDCPGGNRSASLWAGLEGLTGEYFSVLDDDDWWFSDHFEQLFQPLPKARLQKFVAYSGSIVQHRAPDGTDGGGHDPRELHRFGIRSFESVFTVGDAFTINCFVASSDLLHAGLLLCPGMETAEDSYLILSLLAQSQARFSYSATSVYDVSLPGQSSFATHPKRFEDELTYQVRLFGRHRPPFLPADGWTSLAEFWKKQRPSEIPEAGIATLEGWETVAAGYDRIRSKIHRGSHFVDPGAGSAVIRPPAQPWAYGAELFMNRPLKAVGEYVLVAELMVDKGTVGVGFLNVAEDDFLGRQVLAASSNPQTIEIPIWNLAHTGRFVVQNWEMHGKSSVRLLSMRLLAEAV